MAIRAAADGLGVCLDSLFWPSRSFGPESCMIPFAG